jgi:uncharacterized protein
MPSYRHPGVYIEEISQPAPIQGVTTNTLGFVGITEMGVDSSGINPGLYNQPVMITGWNQFSKTYGGIVWNRFLAPAVYSFFKKGGTLCYIVRLQDVGGAVGSATIPTLGTVSATSTGAWSSLISISISNSPSSAPTSQTTPAFTLSVVYTTKLGTVTNSPFDNYIKINNITNDGTSDKPVYVLESFAGLSIPTLDSKATAAAIASAMAPIVNRIASQSLFIRLVPLTTTVPKRPANTADKPIAVSGGADGVIDYGSETTNSGFYAFNSLQDDTVNILAIPDLPTYATKGVIDPAKQAGVINNAATYCQQKMSMFFVADPPFGLSIADMQAYKQGTTTNVPLNNNYGAIYYPWITMGMPGTQNNITIPPSGPVTGVYAATDTSVGVHKAPAGIYDGNIPFALDVERNVTNSDQDVLNPYGVNAIRLLPTYGTCVWGARTLAIDSEWTYVNVRRLFIYLESSIKRACWWVVFEPNSPKLWGTVKRNITAFLTQQWQAGALYGSTADEAFFVKIDEDNNPRELQALGQMHIDIGVAPVYPAEFVIISFQQKTLSAAS